MSGYNSAEFRTQLQIFGRPTARRTDPDTSHEAADSLSHEHIRATQQRILGLLQNFGPMTDHEIEAQWPWPPVSPSGLRTRRAELVDQGRVTHNGQYRTLASGRRARVWKIA